jgi:AcrR family transcriptional regulator
MRARKTRTEIRRDQIVRAAFAVVARHGLRGLSVARLARAVGVVPSGLYRHVAAKEDVIDLMLDSMAERMEGNLELARAQGGNALDGLHGLLERHIELVSRNSAIPRMVFSDELLHRHPAQRRRLHEIVCGYLVGIEGMIRTGQEGGEIDAGVDPAAGSLLFLGLIQPMVLLWTMSRGEFNPQSAVAGSWRLFVAAMAPARSST